MAAATLHARSSRSRVRLRLWWPDLTPPLARWLSELQFCAYSSISISHCLRTGTSSYRPGAPRATSPRLPALSSASGVAISSFPTLRVKDVGIRHATEVTTAVRNIAPMLLMMIFPFASDPLVTVSITILNAIGLLTVLLFVLGWRRVASRSDSHATASEQQERLRPRRLRRDKAPAPWPTALCARGSAVGRCPSDLKEGLETSASEDRPAASAASEDTDRSGAERAALIYA